METLQTIRNRRSIRKYTPEPVSKEDIRTLLEAAMLAPSAGNAQPWHFIVIEDRNVLKQAAALNPYAGMAGAAPLAILVCGDLQAEKYQGFWVQDCSAAMQNLLLAAWDLGLGGVWTGVYPVEERVSGFRKLFHLPDHVIPLGLAVLGHRTENTEPQSRYTESKVHSNSW